MLPYIYRQIQRRPESRKQKIIMCGEEEEEEEGLFLQFPTKFVSLAHNWGW